jgi:hydroxymethylglutaryl-CoA reductase (NADPH)
MFYMQTMGERKQVRTFFNYDKTFEIFIIHHNNFYKGFIDNASENGLGLIVKGEFVAEPNDEVEKLYIHKLEHEYVIEKARVVYSIKSAAMGVRVGVLFNDSPTVSKLKGVWSRILETNPGGSNHPTFKANRIPYQSKNQYSEESIQERIEWIEYICGEKMHSIRRTVIDPMTVAGNIEFYIGAVQVPLGIGGPLLINGDYTKNYVPIPIATTEGALLSSLTRGSYACNLSGGVNVHVRKQVMLRAPVFYCHSMRGALNLEKWIVNNRRLITEKAQSVSSVAQVSDITTTLLGRELHVQFIYSTGDAAGQNMTTSCTYVACEWIVKCIKDDASIRYITYTIEGNLSGDKKINFQNMVRGRGVCVDAEVYINEKTLKRILHVSKKDLLRIYNTGVLGCAKIGAVGIDIDAANVIAGIFTATGQDIASVYESSSSILNIVEEEDGVVCTLHMPSLVIGTVGGGTKLPTQKECLKIMNCYGSDKLCRFAEIIGAACLALDLSTISAVYTREFVTAHNNLGRNRPLHYFSKSDITINFFNDLLLNKDYRVLDFENGAIDASNGILSSFSDKHVSKMCGIHKYNLRISNNGQGNAHVVSTILKLKPTDREILNVAHQLMYLTNDDALPSLFNDHEDIFEYNNCHMREINFYKYATRSLLDYCPQVYGIATDATKELYALLLEDISSLSHYNTINNPIDWWDDASITCALDGIADIHGIFFRNPDAIPKDFFLHTINHESFTAAGELFESLLANNAQRNSSIIDGATRSVYEKYLSDLSYNIKKLTSYPRTLVHNDFQPRNICLRRVEDGYRLVIYDWELMAYHNPQVDIVEFLVSVLPEDMDMETFDHYCDYYYRALTEKTGERLDKRDFDDVLRDNAVYLGVSRYNMYLLSNIIMDYKFINRVYLNLRKLIKR